MYELLQHSVLQFLTIHMDALLDGVVATSSDNQQAQQSGLVDITNEDWDDSALEGHCLLFFTNLNNCT